MTGSDKVLIWSTGRNMWWRENENGYTTDMREAGRYSFDAAMEICINAMPGMENEVLPELPVPEEAAEQFMVTLTLDRLQKMGGGKNRLADAVDNSKKNETSFSPVKMKAFAMTQKFNIE